MRKPWTLTVDPDGNIIVAGPANVDDPSSTELFVAKLESGGTVLWQQRLDRRHADRYVSGGMVEAEEPLRDSVSPVLIDADLQAHRQRRRRPRFFGVGLVAVGLAAVAAVGFASQDHRPLRAFQPEAVAAATTIAMATEMPRPAAAPQPAEVEQVITEEAHLVEVATPAPADVEPPPQLTGEQLRTETIAMLNAQRYGEALLLARAYVDAEPDNAFAYLCLGATLQDLGRAQEAREAYNQCVRQATRGDASDCRALGGSK